MRGWIAVALALAGCKRNEPARVAVPEPIATDAVAPVAPRVAPDAGAGCVREPNKDEVCVDARSALACQNGVWISLSCKGERGCAPGPKGDLCDQSITDQGDTCDLANDFACASSRKEMLSCVKGRWVGVQRCRGARGCVVDGKKLSCDNSIAEANEACRDEDDYACTEDGSSALVCRGGRFTTASLCRGPKGCHVAGTRETGFKVQCDDARARLGDPCSKDGNYSCADDGGAILRCDNGRFILEERCKKKERCAIKSGQVGCY